MKIKSIEIDGFGKFSKTTFALKDGFTLIFGNNEDGKTTLMSFVKMMFFSSSSKTEAGDLLKSLRKKYRPWNGTPMQGAIEFEFNGMDFRIQKEFLKSEHSDKTSIYCKTTGEALNIENKNEAGEYFFGMSLDEFERSVFIGQGGGFAADSSSDSLAIRISNLSVSGDENVSHETIMKRLTLAREELVSKSGKKGLLVEEEQKIAELKFEEQQIIKLEEDQHLIETQIQDLKSEILALETDINRISDEQNLDAAKKELNAFYTLHNKQNSLNAVKNQLEAYGLPKEALHEYIKKAEIINREIDDTLTQIEELSAFEKSASIPDDEYSRLFDLSQKETALKNDISLIENKIEPLENELNLTLLSLAKKLRLSSLIPLSFSLAASIYLYIASFFAFSASVLAIGVILSAIMFFAAKHLVASGLSAKLLKRDIQTNIRNLSIFSSDMLSKNASSLKSELLAKLQDVSSVLLNGLSLYHCENISDLQKKSRAIQTEELEKITEKLAFQKDKFTLLAQTIKNVPSYSSAKIMYVELFESLSSFKALSAEIETLCKVTGIKDSSPSFVDTRIKELGKLIENSPKQAPRRDISEQDLKNLLKEKREHLDECQSKIIFPKRTLREVQRLISEAENRHAALSQRLNEINLAAEIMNEAILDANKGLGSHLSKNVGKYLSELSSNRYSDVIVPRNLGVEIKGSDGEIYHEWKYMSEGAIDRIYLALRLAMTDIIVKGNSPLPLFFDDIFSHYDDENCKNALIFLKNYLKDSKSSSQILFFTCHKHIADMAKDVFDDYNEISL